MKRALSSSNMTKDAAKARWRPKEPSRKIPRDLHEHAQNVARRLMRTKGFLKSCDERKRRSCPLSLTAASTISRSDWSVLAAYCRAHPLSLNAASTISRSDWSVLAAYCRARPSLLTAASTISRSALRRVAQRQSSELQKDQSTRSRQRGCEGRSSMFAMVDLASVPCTSRLSTGRRRSRASEARRGYAANPRAGSRSSFFG